VALVVRLLGPLALEHEGWPVRIGAAKERVVIGERTKPEWRALLAEGCFHLELMTPAATTSHIIEAVHA
jgi:hypothetical protein